MWSDNETTQDLLGYQVHADLLKKIILNDDMLPISIGVFGNWGSGKSSLMLLLQKSLHEWEKSQHEKGCKIILQVYFNSWQFESYDSTKLTMIESILEALDKDINKRKNVFERVDDLLERINFLKAGVFILKKAYENLTPDWLKKWLPTKEDLDKITNKDKYNNLLKDVAKGNTSKFIATFRELFDELVDDMGYKAVVVYIDDLDRCEPKRIIGCLEAVKLFVNVRKTAFIIGADERIIEYAISQHYPIQMKKELINFLPRIVPSGRMMVQTASVLMPRSTLQIVCSLTGVWFKDTSSAYVKRRKYLWCFFSNVGAEAFLPDQCFLKYSISVCFSHTTNHFQSCPSYSFKKAASFSSVFSRYMTSW